MAYKRVIVIYLILAIQIIWPIDIISRAYSTNPGYIFDFLYVITGTIFLLTTSYWEYTNYYLRNVYAFIIGIGTVFILARPAFIGELGSISYESIMAKKQTIILGMIWLILDVGILLSRKLSNDCIELGFPFKNGMFLIAEGGDGKRSFFSNYHYFYWKKDDSMRYATDIIKLNKFGFSNYGFLPKENEKYFIYGEKLYSPFDGVIIAINDGMEDNISYSANYQSGLGNMIVIKQGNYYVLLGHLLKDSLRVSVGQNVKKGDLLAKIGMTGYTPRPHLHMHVVYSEEGDYWNGKGVPIKFKNKVPYKNLIYKA